MGEGLGFTATQVGKAMYLIQFKAIEVEIIYKDVCSFNFLYYITTNHIS